MPSPTISFFILPDQHFLGTGIGFVLSRSDYCVAGVFGAGKTRATAAMIVGLPGPKDQV